MHKFRPQSNYTRPKLILSLKLCNIILNQNKKTQNQKAIKI